VNAGLCAERYYCIEGSVDVEMSECWQTKGLVDVEMRGGYC